MKSEDQKITDQFAMYRGDCVDAIKGIPDSSIHYSVFSPPFASLYVYGDSERDMGNCKDHGEFYKHFRFLVDELFRVTIPGRLLSMHCMNLPTSKARDGFIGISDFRGDLISLFCGKSQGNCTRLARFSFDSAATHPRLILRSPTPRCGMKDGFSIPRSASGKTR